MSEKCYKEVPVSLVRDYITNKEKVWKAIHNIDNEEERYELINKALMLERMIDDMGDKSTIKGF